MLMIAVRGADGRLEGDTQGEVLSGCGPHDTCSVV